MDDLNSNSLNMSVENSDDSFLQFSRFFLILIIILIFNKKKFFLENSLFNNKFGHTKAVQKFYLSLIKEEHDRLKIVELAENLKLEERLNVFLKFFF